MKSKGQPRIYLECVLVTSSALRDGITAGAVQTGALAIGKPGRYDLAKCDDKPATGRVCSSSVAEQTV